MPLRLRLSIWESAKRKEHFKFYIFTHSVCRRDIWSVLFFNIQQWENKPNETRRQWHQLCVSGLSISVWRSITNSLSILWGSEGQPGALGWQNQEENEKNNWKVRFDNGHSSEKQALNWYKGRLVNFQGKMWKHSLSFPSHRSCSSLTGHCRDSFHLHSLCWATV